ncbi:MAG: hypothetical protein R3F59_28060 [Myxococcota bacterium]
MSGGEEGLWWAHLRGFVRAAPEDVWAAAVDPDVGVDRREVDEWTVEDEPRATLDASYRVENTVHDVLTGELRAVVAPRAAGRRPGRAAVG